MLAVTSGRTAGVDAIVIDADCDAVASVLRQTFSTPMPTVPPELARRCQPKALGTAMVLIVSANAEDRDRAMIFGSMTTPLNVEDHHEELEFQPLELKEGLST